jgi:hypothetical protein
VLVQTHCPECGKPDTFAVNDEGLKKWRQGVHIQGALPELSAAKREQMMTGICSPCWDAIFAGDED